MMRWFGGPDRNRFLPRRLSKLVLLGLIAGASFILASVAKRWTQSGTIIMPDASLPADAPDSARLKAAGISPGAQLSVYVLASSRCMHCQRLDTKAAIRNIRSLVKNDAPGFRSVSVIGVGVGADINEELEYINSVGIGSFDEISVGNTWLNDHIVRLIWRDRVAEAAVPQVVIVSRDVSATLRPFALTFGRDSVLKVISGRMALIEWVRNGAAVADAATSLR